MTITVNPDPVAARQKSIAWATRVLTSRSPVLILDTETTGLEEPEIVQLGLLDRFGEAIIDTLLKPDRPEKLLKKHKGGQCASDIHGIYPADVKDCLTFADIYEKLRVHLNGCHLIIYNRDYDWPIMVRSFNEISQIAPQPRLISCAMLRYAAYCGEWNDYFGNWRWQKLPEGDHSAIGDCRSTLALIKKMAQEK